MFTIGSCYAGMGEMSAAVEFLVTGVQQHLCARLDIDGSAVAARLLLVVVQPMQEGVPVVANVVVSAVVLAVVFTLAGSAGIVVVVVIDLGAVFAASRVVALALSCAIVLLVMLLFVLVFDLVFVAIIALTAVLAIVLVTSCVFLALAVHGCRVRMVLSVLRTCEHSGSID